MNLENRGNANINANKEKIAKLDGEVGIYLTENAKIEEDVFKFTKEQEEVVGAGDKLVKLNNLKGKISQKVSAITKEHKFFTENTVCPTCTQTIEEEFRLNRITDAQNKAKELKKVTKNSKTPSSSNRNESVNSTLYPRRLQNSTMRFLKTILGFPSTRDKSEILKMKFKLLPINLQTEILSMRS
jgi:hypothetical protein